MELVGRHKEQKKLSELLKSKKSEFVTVYGRRRVGKTFLIKEFFKYKFDFYMSGLANADTKQQLFNFDTALRQQSSLYFEKPSVHWLEAFQKLISHLESLNPKEKKLIFFDELPWFDTHGSDFLLALEHFWNAWATHRKNVMLIVCGSAASWMINELINHKGGLHNRVTQKLKLLPFNLQETEEFLKAKKAIFNRYQMVQLFMCMGGIPFYLDGIDPGKSATQNIQELFFEKSGRLKNEFFNLYRSLYKNHEIYEKIVETLSSKPSGMQRMEIIDLSGIKSGGTLTKVLEDLEESGFIQSYASLDGKYKNRSYRLADYYTAFYFRFIRSKSRNGIEDWTLLVDHPSHRAWMGFAFEQVCLDHIPSIKKALGISGILSNHASWRGKTEEGKGAQIDLIIDRRDQVINVCECKFGIGPFTIQKSYAETLRLKLAVFKELSKTKNAVHLTMITSYGVTDNSHKDMLVQNEGLLDDLFIN